LADVEGGRTFDATPAGHNLYVSFQARCQVSASALASLYPLQIQASSPMCQELSRLPTSALDRRRGFSWFSSTDSLQWV
jgi:hypothetical protein